MVDGTKYVIDQASTTCSSSSGTTAPPSSSPAHRLVDGFAATPAAARHARRLRGDSPVVILPDRNED